MKRIKIIFQIFTDCESRLLIPNEDGLSFQIGCVQQMS